MHVRKALVVLSRFLLIGWASVWIAALPLFHTHLPSLLQQSIGLPHTIFSPDLPGEYWAFSHKTDQDASELFASGSSSSELGFVASSEEDAKRKTEERSVILILPSVVSTTLASQRIETLPVIIDPNARWFPHIHGLRAPPPPGFI